MSLITFDPARVPSFQVAAKGLLGDTQMRKNVRHATTVIQNKRAIVVDEMPTRAGIDPYNKLVDRIADDNMIDVLDDNGDDPVAREIKGFINAMSEDEQVDLVALMRLGRGDGTIEEWSELRREAADDGGRRVASYLLGEPLVSDYLAEGLEEFGLTWDDERITPV